MMFFPDTPEEVVREEFYKHDKQEAEFCADYYKVTGSERRQMIIRCLACLEYLPKMKVDKELNLTETEYQFARKCACEREKNQQISEGMLDVDDPEEVQDFKGYLSDIGFADLVNNIMER